MSNVKLKVLVVGATGSIGSLVVKEAVRQGHKVRALVRSESKGRQLPSEAEAVVGDLTRSESLAVAVQGMEAIVFTHGSDGGDKKGAEGVDYGGVRNVLQALGSAKPRIALMTAIGVTYREGSLPSEWRGRSEAEVCTSEARKIRVPLARARGGASQEGLVSLLGAERMRSHCVVAVAMGPALRAGTRLLRNSQIDQMLELFDDY